MTEQGMFDVTTHRYCSRGSRCTGLTEALGLVGLKPPVPIDGRHADNFQHAGERGTAIHAMRHISDIGERDKYDFDPNLIGYLDAWDAFKRDYQYSPDWSEKFLVHNVYRFGCIPDSAGPSRLGYMVAEAKSRDLLDEDRLQVEGQAIALTDIAGKKIDARYLVRLFPDGRYHAHDCRKGIGKGYTIPHTQLRQTILQIISIANLRIAREG